MTRRSIRALSCLAAAMLTIADAAQAQNRFDFDTTPGHLSKQVVPSRYVIHLDLDPSRDDFTGTAAIDVRVRQPVPHIELHAHELKAASVRLVTGKTARTLAITPKEASRTWMLTPTDGQPIGAGAHRIEIGYAGPVHGYGEGLYRAPYKAGGKEERMLATQLEAIYARTVFPSFDEPAFRAVFELSVRAPKAYDVASNMPRTARKAEGERVVHRFAPTPSMPTYLAAVAVGRFDVLKDRAGALPLSIITAPGKREHARYAMQATRQLLPYYTQYFGVPYALPKLDQFAVPSTRWGAMEDWGLISYAENNLLVDEKRSGQHTRRNVYETVAHEIAHQWFGNLVTAASWEEIWLNEAFATWLEQKATNHFNPAWKIRLQNRVPVDRAMSMDASTATRAIRSGPVRETAVFEVFDPITYAKGGAVLTMLEQWIGEKSFRNGLVSYMKERRLSNATAADLWHHIGQASGRDVMAVAASWTDQPGFPLVQVKESCEGGRAKLTLTQSRFGVEGQKAQVWKIPVRHARGKSAGTLLLDKPEQQVELGACSPEPLVVNAGGGGFYRVAYEPAALKALTARYAALDEGDRMALLSDTFALMQAGRVPLASYFEVLHALPAVKDSSRTMLWDVARTQLEFLDTAFAGTPAQQQVRATGRAVLGPVLAQLGWTPAPREDAQTSELRGTLIQQLARFDDAPTIAQALAAFDRDESGEKALPPSLREPVIRAAGMHGDRARFDKLLARLKGAASEEDRWLYAKALASTRDPQRAKEVLAATLAGIAPNNVSSSLPGLMAGLSPFGEMAYGHTLDNYKRLADMAGAWGRAYLLPDAAKGFSSPERAAKLLDDQRQHAGPDGASLAAREAEAIRLRAAVKSRESASLEKQLPG